MLVSYPFISKINEPLLGALLAFSGGALVYVGATHLLPQAEAEHKRYSLFALGAGILVALTIILSKA
jgi:ZIP family zinc transporter/zinc and cadmium transporter